MLKIVYPLGSGSKHDNWELRWSLRSLERHAQCDVEPIVVGERIPKWFTGKSLVVKDTPKKKERNIMAKIFAAIEHKLVTGEFQISADDHFWNKPVNLEELPIYLRSGILSEYVGGDNYAKIIAGTREVLLANGISCHNGTVHCNTWCDCADYDRAKRLLAYADMHGGFARTFGLANWAVWPNLIISSSRYDGPDAPHPRRPIAFKHDVKLGNVSSEAFRNILDGQLIISINDDAFQSEAFVGHMTRAYRSRSPWESDDGTPPKVDHPVPERSLAHSLVPRAIKPSVSEEVKSKPTRFEVLLQ